MNQTALKLDRAQLGGAFIIAVLACTILNPLNSSTISVALPILLHALHTNSGGITWIVSGYYLGSAVAQPVMGKLGDAFGRARFVYAGLALMIITAVLAPLSHWLWIFVAWRVIQAIGTSMIYPNAIGLLRVYRSGDVGRALGWIGMGAGIALAVGPTFGGILVDLASWHAIFWLNIPFSLLAMVLFWWQLPSGNTSPVSDQQTTSRRIDVWGMALFTAAITLLLVWSNATHLFASTGWLELGLGLVFTALLIAVERRRDQPILPIVWFKRPQFAVSSLITVLGNLVMYCILYGIPVVLETLRHMSASESGLIMLAFAGVLSVASPLGGRFAQGHRRRFPILLAGLFLTAGTLILYWVDTVPLLLLIVGLGCIGISFAISNIVIQQIVLESVPSEET